MNTLRSLLSYVWVFSSLMVLLPGALICLPLDRKQRVHDWFTWFWSLVMLKICGARFEVRGVEHLRRGGRYVIVANHQSIVDIPILMNVLAPYLSVRFMAKRSIFHVPVLGWAMYAFGHVPIDRGSARKTLPNLQRVQERLKRHFSFLFFPEGTRTATGRVGPFKSAAFRIACRAGAEVLPITIANAVEALPKWRVVIDPRHLIAITIHPPISPDDESFSAAQALERRCRGVIEGALPEHLRSPVEGSPSVPTS